VHLACLGTSSFSRLSDDVPDVPTSLSSSIEVEPLLLHVAGSRLAALIPRSLDVPCVEGIAVLCSASPR
jgi:hypothetical protein